MTYTKRTKLRPRGMGDGLTMTGGDIVDPSTSILDVTPPWGDGLSWDMLFDATSADNANPADNVNQHADGVTTTAADFTNMSGVCKPANFPALGVARELQNQLNRVAQVKGFSKIAPDGAIGPGTLALFRKVQALSPTAIMGDPSSCMGVAPDVDVLSGQVKTFADTLGAPATVDGPLALSVPSITTKSGQTVIAPDAGLLGGLAGMSTIEKLALLGVAGGVGYLLVTKGKKKRRRS
jgi:hypothetical protein